MVYLGGMKIPGMGLNRCFVKIRIESVMCYSESNGIHDYEIAMIYLIQIDLPEDIFTHRFN